MPLLVLKAKCLNKSEQITLEQERYFYDRAKLNANSTELWRIPLCIKRPGSTAQSAAACELLGDRRESFTLEGCSPWVYINADGKGFYRSSYTTDAIESMASAVESALSPAERIMLAGDVWASVAVDNEPIGDYLVLAEGLRMERTSAVLDEVVKKVIYINNYLVGDADRESFELWVRYLLAPLAQDVGWQARPGESEDQAKLRANLMTALGDAARDPQVQALAQKIASQYLADPGSVSPEMASVSLRVAARRGDEDFYNKIMQNIRAAKTPEAYLNDLFALISFTDPKLVERTLKYAISPQMRSQDAVGVISLVMQNPADSKQAWNFVQEHWSAIENLGGPFAGGEIVQATGSFCDRGIRDEVQAFFASHPAPAGERSLKQSLERSNYCMDLKAQQSSRLASWLNNRSASSVN
jgi:aminopeptidase N